MRNRNRSRMRKKIGHAELLSNGVAGEIDPETIVKLTTTNTDD